VGSVLELAKRQVSKWCGEVSGFSKIWEKPRFLPPDDLEFGIGSLLFETCELRSVCLRGSQIYLSGYGRVEISCIIVGLS